MTRFQYEKARQQERLLRAEVDNWKGPIAAPYIVLAEALLQVSSAKLLQVEVVAAVEGFKE